jgi:hypothetical protein
MREKGNIQTNNNSGIFDVCTEWRLKIENDILLHKDD